MKHVALDPREKLKKLSCHRLPGVDIRPGEKMLRNVSHFVQGLVIENIPGLSFEGYNRKPNRRIAVEHVFSSGEDPGLESEGIDDLCPTESTTSRFEKMEKMVEESQEKERSPDIQRYVTKEQLLVIERDLIKKRLPQILKDFNEVSARVSRSEGSVRKESLKTDSQSEKPNISKSQNLDNLKDKEPSPKTTPEVSADKEEPKTSNPSQEEKYTTSFESISSNPEKESSDVESSKTQRSQAKTLSHFSEHFSDENATMCSEEELSPDPSIRQKPPEEQDQYGDKEESEETKIDRKEEEDQEKEEGKIQDVKLSLL